MMDMKKRITYLALSIVAVASLASACVERHPDNFGDIDAVYFNNRGAGDVLLDSTDVTFVYEPLGETKMEIPVTVQLLGRAVGYDRRVDISVTSDNAVEGTDYLLPEEAVLPAGAYSFDYTVTLLRTGELETAGKELKLELHANEFFSLALDRMEQTADTVSTVTYRILFSDMFTTAPAAWEDEILGEFSQAKFELVCRVLGIDPDDFNDAAVMTLPRQMYILEEITGYISDETAKMDAGQDFDEGILDPETGAPLKFQ